MARILAMIKSSFAERLGSDVTLSPCRYILLASLLGVFFGFDLGFIAANQQQLMDFYILQESDITVLVGSYLLGGLLGIFLGGQVVYSSGRKVCMLGGAALGLAAVLAASLAPNFSLLLISQVAVGFSFAIYLLAAGLYINEITAISLRGLSVSLPWVFMAGGACLATFYHEIRPLDSAFVLLSVLGVALLLLVVFGFFYLPESPRWLAFAGYPDAALSTLFKLRRDMGTAARELADINDSCAGEDNGMEFFLQNSNYRRPIWLLLVMCVLLHLGGFIFVPYALLDLLETAYRSSDPFAMFEDRGAIQAMLGCVLLAAVAVALGADRFGRLRCMRCSLQLAMGMLVLLCGAALFAQLYLSSGLVLTIAAVYVFAGACFFYLLMPLMTNELLPMRGREFGYCVLFFIHTALILSGLRAYRHLIGALGYPGYFIMCLLSLLCLMYIVRRFAPDTAGCSLEGIQSRLLAGIALRELGHSRE